MPTSAEPGDRTGSGESPRRAGSPTGPHSRRSRQSGPRSRRPRKCSMEDSTEGSGADRASGSENLNMRTGWPGDNSSNFSSVKRGISRGGTPTAAPVVLNVPSAPCRNRIHDGIGAVPRKAYSEHPSSDAGFPPRRGTVQRPVVNINGSLASLASTTTTRRSALNHIVVNGRGASPLPVHVRELPSDGIRFNSLIAY